jgi:hypothetical protein
MTDQRPPATTTGAGIPAPGDEHSLSVGAGWRGLVPHAVQRARLEVVRADEEVGEWPLDRGARIARIARMGRVGILAS